MKLIKKLLAVTLSAAMTCTMCINFPSEKNLIADAADYSDVMQYGDYLSYKKVDENEDGTYDCIEISDCDQSATEIEIPEEIDGLPVTSIFPRDISTALSENLETIVIPKTVKEIGFSYYMESREINIKGDHLKSVIVSPDNPYFSSEDGVLFNKNKTTLLKYPSAKADTSYVIPETVELIESCAFQKCQNLSSIVIGNGVQKINADAFKGCFAIEKIIVPDNISNIGWGCFIDCISLKSVKLSENITEIGRGTFEGCTSLKSVTIPAKVKKIGMGELPLGTGGNYPGAFSGCSSLEEINVDENNENYASENGILFSKNKDILFLYPSKKNNREYTIPEGVKEIEDAAFRYCDNLESIHFPDSLKTIGYYVFDGCASLETIEVDKDNAYYCDIDGVLFGKIFSELIKYPEGKQNAEYIIPKSVTRIGYAAFSGCDGLKNITIPDGVTIIESVAFRGCDGLKNITIPDSVESIESAAFSGCSNLESITIPDRVTSIGYEAFSHCSNLECITIENPSCEIYDSLSTICNGIDEDRNYYFNGTIYGYKDSTAQAYAEKCGYNFKVINEIPDVTEPTEPTEITTKPVATTTEKPTETTFITTIITTDPAETTKPAETTAPIESTIPAVTTTQPIIIGDPNGDNIVNVRDCAYIALMLAKNQADKLPETADFNGDGKVNVRDAAAIASYLAKNGK